MNLGLKTRAIRISDDTPVPHAIQALKLEKGFEYCEKPLPEIYDADLGKYFRRFEDVPANFIQTLQDTAKIVTAAEVAASLDHDVNDCKRHVMLVGGPGVGKSVVGQNIIRRISERKAEIGRKWFFSLDLRFFSGDEVFFVPHFLFRRNAKRLQRPGQPDNDSDEYIFGLGFEESPLLHFFLDGLDTMRCKFEDTVKKISLNSHAPVSTILSNLLSGTLMPHCRIISTCRDFRLRYFHKNIYPHRILIVGELPDLGVMELMFRVYGDKWGKKYYFSWKRRSQELYLLNRTANNLACNLLSANCAKSYALPVIAPMVALNLVMSFTNPAKHNGSREHAVPIIHKMTKIAYLGSLESKRVFNDDEIMQVASLTRQEVDTMTACCSINETNFAIMRRDLPKDRLEFVDSLIHEFLCALHVFRIPISEYEVFLEDKLHTPRFHLVRQMLCSLMFDSFMNKTARKERLIEVDVDDLTLRRELLQKSMVAQFHKVKRWDLLEFFRTIRDCRDGAGKLNIVPKQIDLVDLSHIQLFALDMQAIGCALADVKVGCLNLSNCEISSDGMDALNNALSTGKTMIHTFKLDWNVNWYKSSRGVKALREMIKVCEVKEISWNHSQIDDGLLICLNLFLGDATFNTLRIEHNGPFTIKGYGYLGEFVSKHKVKELFITAGNMTKKQIKELGCGEGQMMLALPDGRKLDIEANDFTLRP